MAARTAALVALGVFAATVATAADTHRLDGAVFPARVELADQQLPLRGAGTLRYGLIFKAYVAALYAEPVPGPRLLHPATARRLEIVYFVDIPSRRIATFAEQRLAEQLGEAAWAALAPRVRAWHARFLDVNAGDRYVMEYSGGRLSLVLNGETLVRVDDPELAGAYFGLWLGEQPIDEDLRAALLGTASGA